MVASSTAPTVPIVAFSATVARTARPSSWTVSGPSSYAVPPGRRNGTKTATNSTSGSTKRARRQISRGGIRAAAAIAASTTPQAANTGQAASGVETATSVIARIPTTFARGSRRWTGLAGSPASPVSSRAWLQSAPMALPASAGGSPTPEATANTPSVPTKPATPVATRSFSMPGKA